jgi:2'-5' RNA ligase
MKTSAVASVLDPTQSSGNAAVWQTVERISSECGIEANGVLHFSWHVAEQYDTNRVRRVLEDVAGKYRAFEIYTAGLGLFTGVRPVLYLPVVKTQWMAQLHSDLWNALDPFAMETSLLYSPLHWMPHITLVYEESHPELVYKTAKQLMNVPLKMELTVDHFALIYQNDQAQGLLFSIPFGGAS